MFRTARLPLLLVLLVAALAAPAAASADSGAITNVQRGADGTATATFTATSTFCGASGYCGFFAYARAVPAAQPCAVGQGRAIWVSDDVAGAAGTLGGTETFAATEPEALRLCLFLFQAGDREYAIAETVLDPASGTAPPSTTPPGAPPATTGASATRPAAPRVRTLALAGARTAAAKALQKKYGRAYKRGTGKRSTCKRQTATRVRCTVSWRYKGRRYRGTVTVSSSSAGKLSSKLAIRRSR